MDLANTTPEERRAAVLEETDGRGVDVVIEASGNPAALPEAFDLVRDGGTYVVAGHYTDAGPVSINPHLDLNRKHLDLRGQWGTEFHHLVRALAVLGRHQGRLPFARVIGGRYGLEEANQALADVASLSVIFRASSENADTTSRPSSGNRRTNFRNVSRTSSIDEKMSTWSSSTEVKMATCGR